MPQKILYMIGLLVLMAACSRPPAPTISREQAIALLNAGQVASIGMSHSGWTSLSLLDGTVRGNWHTEIGGPESLLSTCADCSNVSQWIE